MSLNSLVIFATLNFLSFSTGFHSFPSRNEQGPELNITETDTATVYKTNNLVIKRLSEHVYQHISYLQTKEFGKVACNGMLVINEDKGIILDTPTNDQNSLELINFITSEFGVEITGVIPTHFHSDCLGGIQEFKNRNIPVYISEKTGRILDRLDRSAVQSTIRFKNDLNLSIGAEKIEIRYFGQGHTRDNVIGYLANENIMFGGCLIKSSGASKGNLEDANTRKWPGTIRKIRREYPGVKMIVPGHGAVGGKELLNYTTKLFQ